MNTDARKSKRVTDFIEVDIFVKNRKNGNTVAGPFSGRIIDVSLDGACMLMSQVQSETCHVYYSPQKNQLLFLQIAINNPPKIINLNISALPVWLNTYESDEFQERILGVKFIDKGEQQESGPISKIFTNL